jgi:DNA-binding transcriptional LysR family regulator
MDPEARLLRYFLAVAQELNFTRAAESLGIAQPALSSQIRRLEAQLGVPLLERTTRSVQLTEAGRVLQERGPAALAALADVWEAARRAGRGEAGRLRIVYSPSAGYETAPRLVDALRARHPEVEIAADVMSSAEIVRAVQDGDADVGIARTPVAAEGVRLRTVRLEPQGLIVPADHPLATRTEADLATAAEHPLLMHPREANPEHFDRIVEQFRRAALTPRFVTRAMGFDPNMRAIRDGTGIALVGASSAQGLAGDLRWIPVPDAAALPVQLVLRAGEPTPTADRFERVAVAAAAAAGWLGDPARQRSDNDGA